MDFGELNNDKPIQTKIKNLHKSVDKIEHILNVIRKDNRYDNLDTMEKVNYDLFLSYSLNTLYWLYLRTKGKDPNNDDIKNELKRVREYMVKAKQAHDRNTIRPKLNKEVANRFVKHGIWSHKDDKTKGPPNKKTKFK